jgi:hypothetical protein
MKKLKAETDLIAACAALLDDLTGVTPAEERLVEAIPLNAVKSTESEIFRHAIRNGKDPLGEAFSLLRAVPIRRRLGAVYTPWPIVSSILRWLTREAIPDRVVDPGAGSGRFILAAGRYFPKAELVAIEMDPVAALILRANAGATGMANRLKIIVSDYRVVTLPKIQGVTAYDLCHCLFQGR